MFWEKWYFGHITDVTNVGTLSQSAVDRPPEKCINHQNLEVFIKQIIEIVTTALLNVIFEEN